MHCKAYACKGEFDGTRLSKMVKGLCGCYWDGDDAQTLIF